MWWRRIDVSTTSFLCHVPAGYLQVYDAIKNVMPSKCKYRRFKINWASMLSIQSHPYFYKQSLHRFIGIHNESIWRQHGAISKSMRRHHVVYVSTKSFGRRLPTLNMVNREDWRLPFPICTDYKAFSLVYRLIYNILIDKNFIHQN